MARKPKDPDIVRLKTMNTLYKSADQLEEYFKVCCSNEEYREDHAVLRLQRRIKEEADWLWNKLGRPS